MRAHFAESIPASPDSIDEIEPEPLEARIEDFKQDTKNMAVLTEFIDDVLITAEAEANKQQNEQNAKNSQQPKEKSRQSFAIPDFKNGKVVNRARGFVVRIFDAICNCANNAAAAPTARFKLRSGSGSGSGGRQATTQNNDAAAVQFEDKPAETLALNKPDKKNGKEKKPKKGVKLCDEPETIEMLKD